MLVPLAEVIERTNEGGPAGPPREFPLLRAEGTRAAADPMRRHVASPEQRSQHYVAHQADGVDAARAAQPIARPLGIGK